MGRRARRPLRVGLAIAGLILVTTAVVLGLTAGAQAGGPERQLSGASLWYPVWSPDGTHVAWLADTPDNYDGTVWVASSSGRRARPLHTFQEWGTGGTGQIAWESPRSLLVDAKGTAGAGSELFRLSLSGRVEPVAQVLDLNFSLDRSRRLVAIDDEDCGAPDCQGAVKILNLATRRMRQVGSSTDINVDPVLSPDGRRVLYEASACLPVTSPDPHCNIRSLGVWLAPLSGRRRPHRIIRAGYCPVWSPDGRSIAYRPPLPLSGWLDVLRLGGRTRRVAHPLDGCGMAFSPDSRFITYQPHWAGNCPPCAGTTLAVLDLRSRRIVLRSPRRLGAIDNPTWSPDGSKILVLAGFLHPTGFPNCIYVVTVKTRRWRTFRPCK